MGKLLVMTKRARQIGRDVWDRGDRCISLTSADDINLSHQAQEIYNQFRNALVEGWDEARKEAWRLNVSMGAPFVASTYHRSLDWNYVYLSPPPPPEVGWKVIHREAS